MTSKERARLRGLANSIDTVLQIGKDGIGETLIHQADITLEARELIKGRVLEGCMDYTPRTAAEALAEATGSEVVQVIGSKFVLYRKKSPDAAKKTVKPRQGKNARDMGKHGTPERKPSLSDRGGPRKASAPERTGQRKPFTPDHAAPRKASVPERTGQRKPFTPDRGTPRKPSAPERTGQRKPFTPDHAAPRKASVPERTGQRKPFTPDRGTPRKPSAPERTGQRKPFTPDHAAPRKPSAPKVTGPRKGGFQSGPARAGRRDTPHRAGKPSYGTGKPSYGGKNRK